MFLKSVNACAFGCMRMYGAGYVDTRVYASRSVKAMHTHLIKKRQRLESAGQ